MASISSRDLALAWGRVGGKGERGREKEGGSKEGEAVIDVCLPKAAAAGLNQPPLLLGNIGMVEDKPTNRPARIPATSEGLPPRSEDKSGGTTVTIGILPVVCLDGVWPHLKRIGETFTAEFIPFLVLTSPVLRRCMHALVLTKVWRPLWVFLACLLSLPERI